MFLPFAFEKIAAGRSIICREEQISLAVSLLEKQGGGFTIYDTPRSGKETVAREAIERYMKGRDNVILCEVDLFNIRSFSAFLALMRNKMEECVCNSHSGAELLIDKDFSYIKDTKVLELPQILARENRIEIIIYFKEFQNVAFFEEENGLSLELMDKIWSKQDLVRYVFTGSSIYVMKGIFEEKKLFYSITSRVELPRIPKKQACEYICNSFINVGRVIEMEEAMDIYSIAGGNMWYIQQLCRICLSMPAGYINKKIVNDAKETLISIHSSRYLQTMLDLTLNQINFLKALIDGVEKFSSADILESYKLNSSANVFRIKDALAKKGVINFEKEDSARILDPFFEYWLRNYYFSR